VPNLKEIKTRIGSVKSTEQITKAMKLVSTSKLKKAQDNIQGCRPYALNIKKLIEDIAQSRQVSHPLLEEAEVTNSAASILFVVVTSDRGLCGGFNNNVSRWADQKSKELAEKYERIDFKFIGKKGRDYFKSRSIKGVGEARLNLAKEISYDLAKEVADEMLDVFESGRYDEIHVVYNEFKSAIQQDVVCERILPLKMSVADTIEKYEDKDLIFEPHPAEIIDVLLEKHFTVQVYRVLSESIASEHAARMTAMDNASSNAKDAIEKLTLQYNKMRQASITTELIEITSGAEALKG
jgi:F-type H+-transporting ATPase subunit gamma